MSVSVLKSEQFMVIHCALLSGSVCYFTVQCCAVWRPLCHATCADTLVSVHCYSVEITVSCNLCRNTGICTLLVWKKIEKVDFVAYFCTGIGMDPL